MPRVRGFNKRAPRIDVRRPAVVINSDGVEAAVVLLDVSSGGFRLKISELLADRRVRDAAPGARRGISRANPVGVGRRGWRGVPDLH